MLNLDQTLKLHKKQQQHAAAVLGEALARGRSPRARRQANLLQPRDGVYLSAVNPNGRIIWGNHFIREVFRYFQMGDDQTYPHQTIFLVTLADRSLNTTDVPQRIKLKKIKYKLASGLRGLSYLGMIEPGYYVNVADTRKGYRTVSWHGHFLVWGTTFEELTARIELLKPKFQGIRQGIAGAHRKQIERYQFGEKLCYILKSPSKEYSVGKLSEVVDGEETFRFKHNSRKIRPGNRIKVFRMMTELYIDHLAMAGGKGDEILVRIKDAALRGYRRIKQR